VIEIKIIVNDAGQLNVSGNIQDRVQAFGLLEIGRQVLCEHYKAIDSRLVQPASALDIPPKL
jgi:hypothetical protein